MKLFEIVTQSTQVKRPASDKKTPIIRGLYSLIKLHHYSTSQARQKE
jgi:hypothetical protein